MFSSHYPSIPQLRVCQLGRSEEAGHQGVELAAGDGAASVEVTLGGQQQEVSQPRGRAHLTYEQKLKYDQEVTGETLVLSNHGGISLCDIQ